MAVLSADMKRIVTEQKLGFVATAGADGTPNLSPKGTFLARQRSSGARQTRARAPLYGSPPIAEERLNVDCDGLVVYKVKHPFRAASRLTVAALSRVFKSSH